MKIGQEGQACKDSAHAKKAAAVCRSQVQQLDVKREVCLETNKLAGLSKILVHPRCKLGRCAPGTTRSLRFTIGLLTTCPIVILWTNPLRITRSYHYQRCERTPLSVEKYP
jgi:hypothetical protein